MNERKAVKRVTRGGGSRLSDEETGGSVRVSVIRKEASDSTTARSAQLDVEEEFLSGMQNGKLGQGVYIQPPYNIRELYDVIERSNAISQCVAAYVTNVVMSGWEAMPIHRDREAIPSELEELKSFISHANSEESLESVVEKVMTDREMVGFGFYEVVRDASGYPAVIRHAPALYTRLCVKHPEVVNFQYTILRGSRNVTVTEGRRFRRFLQLVNGSFVYFKEFGDPRKMDRETGDFEGEPNYKPGRDATEILHDRLMSPDPYGLPRWIPQLPNIIGSREAEEVNMRYFQDNTVPPILLTVANGKLTRQSYKELTDVLHRQEIGKNRQNKIMLIEAVGMQDSMDSKAPNVDIKVDKLADARQSDGLFKEYDASNQAKLRSCWRLPPAIVGQSQDVNFACYDQATEFLSDRGWLYHTEWTPGTKVAVFDHESGDLRFEEPNGGILRYSVTDLSMYAIRTNSVDMLVTPNHQMVYAASYGTAYSMRPIERMVEVHTAYMPTGGAQVTGEDLETVSIPYTTYHGGIAATDAPVSSIPADLLLELVGYVAADGCVIQDGRAVSFGAKKHRKVEAFRALVNKLADCGFRTRETTNSAGTYFAISHKGLGSWFVDNVGVGSRNKRIPSEFYALSPRQSSLLLNSLLFCDGHHDTREGRDNWQYSSTSCLLSDGVQALAVKCGYRTRASVGRVKGFGNSDAPLYRLTLSAAAPTQVKISSSVSRQPYTGTVYCFSVSTGAFVTRRNGKVALQGNTASTSISVAESQVFAPARFKNDELLNKNFINGLRGLRLRTVCLVSRTPAITSPDQIIKAMTALNVMGAMTPRAAQKLANTLLQIEMPEYPNLGETGYEEWMDLPLTLSAKANSPEDSATSHVEQNAKTDSLKDTEDTGDINGRPPKHGQE